MIRTVEEMVGRSDLLKRKEHPESQMADKIDLSAILNNPFANKKQKVTFDPKKVYDFHLEKTMDEKVLLKKIGDQMRKGEKASLSVKVGNTDRSFGTIFGAELTRCHKDGLPEDTIQIQCEGAGGQSFGAFIPKGMTLSLCGDTNDYFGKGLSGGKLILYPPKKRGYRAQENIIAGNVAFCMVRQAEKYLSTELRRTVCVRIPEHLPLWKVSGEHGCEYMTGGRVVILGSTGKNFAAGMSGRNCLCLG